MWLEINDKGKVAASEHRAGENTVFYLVPVGMREVAIQNVASGRYIAINSKGKLFSKESYDQECIFKVSVFWQHSTVIYASGGHPRQLLDNVLLTQVGHWSNVTGLFAFN